MARQRWWAQTSSLSRIRDHTQTHHTHNRHTFMPLVGFEPAIPAGERAQTYALDRVGTGIGSTNTKYIITGIKILQHDDS
jgi:hypothetical protein